MRKYKGGALNNARDRFSDFKDDNLRSNSWYMRFLEIGLYIWLFFIIIDIFALLPINMIYYQGPSRCITDDWLSLFILTPASYFTQYNGTKCSDMQDTDTVEGGKCQGGLGRWQAYDKIKKGFLCSGEATQIFNDAVSDNKMAGYNGTEILAYIIIPTLTIVGIIYALIFTRMNKAEWIFWILITTLIYTGTSSIASSTNIDILPPDQPSPLTYITNKLNFKNSDELQYNFMARMSNGSTCLVEGVMLGAGMHSSEGAPTYTGDCTAESLPLS